eukprot:Lithocolla_globosa_v1_NODE_5859_length_1174_cov_6.188561.p2 type:complete len:138 gc:universal NODE_5859_length_1174_cov_6.188561:597-1010(+)
MLQYKLEICKERFAKENLQVWCIDDKEIYDLLQYKGKLGGPSVVFHRYHEKWETKIRRAVYDENTKKWNCYEEGKWVRQVVGFDANVFYLLCLGQKIVTGRLTLIREGSTTESTREHVLSGELFGFVESDIGQELEC